MNVGPEYTDDGGWGSHQPALRAIARFTDVRSVIEFGGGVYSTRLFLNREAFPLLESLVTFEHDAGWGKHIETGDPRHQIIIVEAAEFIPKSAGMRADLVFVDCVGDRGSLVRHGLTLAPIAAIHDFEKANLDGLNFKSVRWLNSKIQTAVVSDTVDLSRMTL